MSHSPIFCTQDAQRLARRKLPRLAYDYVDGAAGTEGARCLNQSAIRDIRLQPRVLKNVEGRTLQTDFLGHIYDLPFGIAPMGMCNIVDPNADRFLAEEAMRRNVPHCLSCASSTTMENMRTYGGDNMWFQLYVLQSMDLAREMIDRAERAGYETLVFTVDVPQVARRVRDLRNGFTMPFKIGPKQLLDFAKHPTWSIRMLLAGSPKPMNFETSKVSKGFPRHGSRGAVDWDFLKWLRNRWRGTLVVKGVISGDDALTIKRTGTDAVWVSNHGGRQLDSAPASIHALERVRAAVGPDYPLIFDSGVETGEDIVTALAVGADYVMAGRPFQYAIGADGVRGLSALFDILEEDISTTMAQLGVTEIEQIDQTVLAPKPNHHEPEAHMTLSKRAKG